VRESRGARHPVEISRMIILGKRALCKTKSYLLPRGFSGILKAHSETSLEIRRAGGTRSREHVMADVAQTRQAERGLSEAARVLERNLVRMYAPPQRLLRPLR
jgi:hypothetical protein